MIYICDHKPISPCLVPNDILVIGYFSVQTHIHWYLARASCSYIETSLHCRCPESSSSTTMLHCTKTHTHGYSESYYFKDIESACTFLLIYLVLILLVAMDILILSSRTDISYFWYIGTFSNSHNH